jgi:type VI secretion system protein ImpK
MMDCFFDVLARTVHYREQFKQGSSPDYEEVRLEIDRALSEHAMDYIKGGYSETHYSIARYAVIAFIDEAILSSTWQHKDKWKKELLQMKFYQTVKAGEEFFHKLNMLSSMESVDKEIREVYYYCLMLGFCGKYFDPADQHKLAELKNTNLLLMVGGKEKLETLHTEILFPKAYIPKRKSSGAVNHLNLSAFYYGIPVLVLLGLFFWFKMEILEVANYLLSTI